MKTEIKMISAGKTAYRKGKDKSGIPKKLSASFTIEAAFIFAILFLALSSMIRFAFRQRDSCLAGFVLSEYAQEASHLETVYNPEGPDPEEIGRNLQDRLFPIRSLRSGETDLSRGKREAAASSQTPEMNLRIERPINDPENMMRAATAVSDFAEHAWKQKGDAINATDSE